VAGVSFDAVGKVYPGGARALKAFDLDTRQAIAA
jgi:hypothetical protein